MADKIYAVAKGKTPGIYFTWDDCRSQVEHFSGAVYKSFTSIREASEYIESITGMKLSEDMGKLPADNEGNRCADNSSDCPVSSGSCLVAYVDGSYEHSKRRYAYGCVMVLPDEIVKLNGYGDDEDYISMRNVAGEILGSEKAIIWAVEHSYKEVVIYYDYEGIEKWADDIWKANKPGTIRYKQFVADQRKNIKISFKKVAAHTGDTYNEMADQLAKAALDLGVCEADS